MRRPVLWGALVALLVVAQSMLVYLTANYERVRAQEQVDTATSAAAADIRQSLSRQLQSLQALQWNDPGAAQWRDDAASLLHGRHDMMRIERRDLAMRVIQAVDSPYQAPLFERIARSDIELEAHIACATARRIAGPAYSRSYFVPLADGLGMELMDVCLPLQRAGRDEGLLVATLALGRLLEDSVAPETARSHELSLVEGDGTRLARAGARRGRGVFVTERIIDLPGQSLQLRMDSVHGSPSLIPNLAVALVLGLSFALAVVVALLVRDVRRRADTEARLAETLSFRKAMEDSLVTGLRARDLSGRITHVNQAFCEMVGFSEDELIAPATPPYWPPELAAEYARHQSTRLGGPPAAIARTPQEARAGFETIFMRRNGERFPVLIFEAPLVDGQGRHTGWMSSVLDVSAQRRVEELSRQQQERLQATARLVTMGEMASTLAHELNQPLAAISSYNTGCLNMLEHGSIAPDELTGVLQKIGKQAQRAAQIIRRVHAFVRRSEPKFETVDLNAVIREAVGLVEPDAARRSVGIDVDLADGLPPVLADPVMIEQVAINLIRNGMDAMADTPRRERRLHLATRAEDGMLVFSVTDRGRGIDPEVAEKLFAPFFTTKEEGMGMGLNICRSIAELHRGRLSFEPNPDGGTIFRFTLPVPHP